MLRRGTISTAYKANDELDFAVAHEHDVALGLGAYREHLAKYPYLEDDFDLPDPALADFLLPFGDLFTKYFIQSAATFILGFAQGVGDFFSKPTLYIFKNVGLSILQDIQTGFLSTAHQDNSELYEQATAFFGQDVLFNSTVIAADRSVKGSVKLVVNTPKGPKLILAKRLVIAFEPVRARLAPFDLSTAQRNVFNQFSSAGYCTSVVRNLGIPDNGSITNIGSNTLYKIPKLPAIYAISAKGIPNLHNVCYDSAAPLSSAQVQSNILADLNRLVSTGTADSTARPEFAIFSNHAIRAYGSGKSDCWWVLQAAVCASGAVEYILYGSGVAYTG